MRKICLVTLVLAISLMVSVSYAQTPRAATRSDGKTTFTNIATTGYDVTGVPSYIELVDGSGNRFYLYIADDRVLRMASATQVGTTSVAGDPQTTTWGHVGDKVGAQ